MESVPLASDCSPTAVDRSPLDTDCSPSAVAASPLADEARPSAVEASPLAVLTSPIAVPLSPLAVAFLPTAVEFAPIAVAPFALPVTKSWPKNCAWASCGQSPAPITNAPPVSMTVLARRTEERQRAGNRFMTTHPCVIGDRRASVPHPHALLAPCQFRLACIPGMSTNPMTCEHFCQSVGLAHSQRPTPAETAARVRRLTPPGSPRASRSAPRRDCPSRGAE